MTRWTVVRQVRELDAWVDDATWEPFATGNQSLAVALAAMADYRTPYDWRRHVVRGTGNGGVRVEEAKPNVTQ